MIPWRTSGTLPTRPYDLYKRLSNSSYIDFGIADRKFDPDAICDPEICQYRFLTHTWNYVLRKRCLSYLCFGPPDAARLSRVFHGNRSAQLLVRKIRFVGSDSGGFMYSEINEGIFDVWTELASWPACTRAHGGIELQIGRAPIRDDQSRSMFLITLSNIDLPAVPAVRTLFSICTRPFELNQDRSFLSPLLSTSAIEKLLLSFPNLYYNPKNAYELLKLDFRVFCNYPVSPPGMHREVCRLIPSIPEAVTTLNIQYDKHLYEESVTRDPIASYNYTESLYGDDLGSELCKLSQRQLVALNFNGSASADLFGASLQTRGEWKFLKELVIRFGGKDFSGNPFYFRWSQPTDGMPELRVNKRHMDCFIREATEAMLRMPCIVNFLLESSSGEFFPHKYTVARSIDL